MNLVSTAFAYTPETHGLNIPFIGEVHIVLPLIIVGAVIMFWPHIPTILWWVLKTAPKVGKWLIDKLKGVDVSAIKDKVSDGVSSVISAEDKDAPVDSLHSLTEWAIETRDAEALSKVTSLYLEVQKRLPAVAALLMCVGLAGCSDIPEGRACGYREPDAQTQQKYQGREQTLRDKAPGAFE